MHVEKPEEHEEYDMDTDVPPAPGDSSTSEGLMQQLLSEVHTLSLQQQQLVSHFDTF